MEMQNHVVFTGKVVKVWKAPHAGRRLTWARLNHRTDTEDYYVTVWLPNGTQVAQGQIIRVEGKLGSYDFTQPLVQVVRRVLPQDALPEHLRHVLIPRAANVIIAEKVEILR